MEDQLKDQESKPKESSTSLSNDIKRPPVVLQKTELLKAIENQNIEIIAVIDANPQPKSMKRQYDILILKS